MLRLRFGGLVALVCLASGLGGRAADKLVWKQMDEAILRIDDQPPKDWNIYRANKKGDVLLLKLGTRFLLLDTRKQEVREIDPASVTQNKNTLTNAGGEKDGKSVPSSAWSVRDIGAARRILFKLDSENHSFTIELPQWINRAVTY
jgi:hypothetical protein